MLELRLAFRSLSKTPLVAGVAIVSLAFGMGANAAIFSLFERMVLRPLPVLEPQRLVNLSSPGPKSGSQSSTSAGDIDAVFSYPMFRDLEKVQSVFSGIAAHRTFGVNLAFEGSTSSGTGMLVSGRYFGILGLRPTLGRLLGPEDDRTPGETPVVVLSHAYWRTSFNADPGVIEQSLMVNGHPMTIVGVGPAGFRGTTLGQDPKVFVPITMRGVVVPGWEGFDNRRSYWVYLFARLAPGVSLEEASVAVSTPYAAILREVELPLQEEMSQQTSERFVDKKLLLEDGRRGQSAMQKEARAPLLLLLGVSGFVLLIACANIANLLLTRAANRAGEMALRLSIGARRRHLVSQLLTESFLLAFFGGALGLLVAQATLRLFISILPSEAVDVLDLGLGPTTWLFLAGLVVVTGMVGLLPALHSTRSDLVTALKGQSAQASRSRGASRFRALLATGQVAMSIALLVSAGLFSKSLLNVSRVELGIDVEHLATFGVSPELNGYAPEASRSLFERLQDELDALPGVTGVTVSMVPLIAGSNWGSNVTVQGFPSGPDIDTMSNYNEIGSGYFRTLGIPLLAGREFEHGDALGAPKVAIVNEAFSRKFHLGRDAVGKRLQVGSGGELDIEIVGLVRDAKYSDVKRPVPPLFFLPYRQDDSLGSVYFYVRSPGDPVTLLNSLREVVARIDPNLPVDDLMAMEYQVRENVLVDRVLGTLSTGFAILATLLAAVGLYGVLAYSVAQRSREIGLRMALGADGARVRRLILRQVSSMVIPGAALGLAVAIALGRVASALLFEIEGYDPTVIAVAVAVLAVVAGVAGLVPAQRAARIDPAHVLRSE